MKSGIVTDSQIFRQNNKGVCHTVALPFIYFNYLKAKEEWWKFKYFTMQKYNLQKNPLQETKLYYN
jgi:hypothetical protein